MKPTVIETLRKYLEQLHECVAIFEEDIRHDTARLTESIDAGDFNTDIDYAERIAENLRHRNYYHNTAVQIERVLNA